MKKSICLFFIVAGLLKIPLVWAETPQTPLQEFSERLRKEVDGAHDLASHGKMDEAIGKLRDLLKNAPPELDPIRIQYELANLLFLQGRYREARAAYHLVLVEAEDKGEMISRTRERIAKMKEREVKKKDEMALQLIDIETALDTGQIPPEGSKQLLKKIVKDSNSEHQAQAQQLLQRMSEMEDVKARELLNEARRLFDKEKNYVEVLNLLDTVQHQFPDSEEMLSVKILIEETERKLGRKKKPEAYVPSVQEAR